MPQVHKVKSAAKDHPECGVKKGETYYWWKQRLTPKGTGVKRCSKSYPRQSVLTSSPFWSAVWSIKENIADTMGQIDNTTDLASFRDEVIGEIENLRDEVQGNLDNMPEQLQEGDTGQMLQERIGECENWIAEIESLDAPDDPEDEDEESDEEVDVTERFTDYLSAMDYDLSCS